jgi:hypothetical protein
MLDAPVRPQRPPAPPRPPPAGPAPRAVWPLPPPPPCFDLYGESQMRYTAGGGLRMTAANPDLSVPARAEHRRFWPLSALRPNTKPPQTDDVWGNKGRSNARAGPDSITKSRTPASSSRPARRERRLSPRSTRAKRAQQRDGATVWKARLSTHWIRSKVRQQLDGVVVTRMGGGA